MKGSLFTLDDLCVKVYDVNEPDINKKLIGVYSDFAEASRALGTNTSTLQKTYERKGHTKSLKLGKIVTVRLFSLDKLTPEQLEPIKKYRSIRLRPIQN